MPHCDEETLSLLALGEPGPSEVEAHVADCPRCSAELEALRHVVAAVRAPQLPAGPELIRRLVHLEQLDPAEIVPIAPPPSVWAGVAAGTGVRSNPRAEALQPQTVAPAVAPRSWRARFDVRLISVAAGALILGLLVGVIGTRIADGDQSRADPAPVVAATRLAGLPAAPSATGDADVTADGTRRVLHLDVHDLAATNGFYEVWLINSSVTKMVPVGVLSGSVGHYALPAGIDLADYPLVDISVEPMDGDPAHSGKSVLRGSFSS